jgi:hypothetical protein
MFKMLDDNAGYCVYWVQGPWMVGHATRDGGWVKRV